MFEIDFWLTYHGELDRCHPGANLGRDNNLRRIRVNLASRCYCCDVLDQETMFHRFSNNSRSSKVMETFCFTCSDRSWKYTSTTIDYKVVKCLSPFKYKACLRLSNQYLCGRYGKKITLKDMIKYIVMKDLFIKVK